MYASLVAGLPREVRDDLDGELGVTTWQRPTDPTAPVRALPTPDRDPAAPAWWHGDEEASQSWLRGMGVTLD